jgi:hypothetical protein
MELNPGAPTTGEKVAAGLTQASFIYYLGAASSALLQPLSVFQTGYPVLMARHGPVRAARELAKRAKFWNQYGVYRKNSDGSMSFVMPSMEHATGTTAEERKALQSAAGYNLFASTFADSVFNYKNSPSGKYSSPITQFGKDTVNTLVLGGLMHTTERISREMLFLSSFNLNREKGKSFEEAVEAAVSDTNEALFNYNEYNRPDFMRGATGKVITQFKMYPVQLTGFLIRNFVEMIKPMRGRTRTEAMAKFFGTMGTTFVLAGAVGLPGFSVVMGMLGWAWSKLQDEDDNDEVRKNSFELWLRTIWLQEQLGEVKIAGKSLADTIERGVANAITGLDISGRTSLNNLWMRDTKETARVRDSAAALALEFAGPTANMLVSWAEGFEAMMRGKYADGMKKIAPAGFRNFITTYEQSTKGAEDAKGAKILSKDAFTTGELIGQAVGFRSDLLANTQNLTFKVIGIQQKINNERNELMDRLDREYRNKDVKAYGETYKKMMEFNRKHPTFAITPESLQSSMESRQEQRAQSYRGVTLTEKNMGLARALIASRREATEREKENREK